MSIPGAPLAPPPSIDREFMWKVENYVNDYTRYADTKVAFVVAVVTAILGAAWKTGLHHNFTQANYAAWGLKGWTSLIAFALLSLTLVISVFAVRPAFVWKAQRGFIFWYGIASHATADDFRTAFEQQGATDLDKSLSDHLYQLAKVCALKYRLVSLSIILGFAGAALSGLVLLFS